MESLTHLATVLRFPQALKPLKQIFLMSHMRCNTSVFGHIMGAHPEIEGYYEMHLGYYSWRSPFRQRLLYFRDHLPKKSARFMFDKVLHSDHYVAPSQLQKKSTSLLFSLREPEQTIPSIQKLYRKVDPVHEYCQEKYAFDYYCERVLALSNIASSVSAPFFYYDANCVRQKTDELLSSLSQWLDLDLPLQPDYKIQPKTSKGNSGDHSANLQEGSVVSGSSDYSDTPLSSLYSDQANAIYTEARAVMLKLSARSVQIP